MHSCIIYIHTHMHIHILSECARIYHDVLARDRLYKCVYVCGLETGLFELSDRVARL